jgi:hypothetical protein
VAAGLCYKRRMEPASSTAGALARIGAVAAPIGAVVLIVSTLLHPMEADPDDAPAAFAEYAADPLWVWSHLGQFVGVAVLVIVLIGLAATLEAGLASKDSALPCASRSALCIAMPAALRLYEIDAGDELGVMRINRNVFARHVALEPSYL